MKKTLWAYLVLLFILGFDLWLNNSSEASSFFTRFIEPYTDKRKFSAVWTLLIVVGMIIHYRQELGKKEAEKKEIQAITRTRMEMLVMANQELSSYRERDILLNVFQRFVSVNPYVLAVQLYEYSMQHNHGKTSIKLKLTDGYVRENIDVNAAQQTYYSFDIGLFREFRDAYDRLFIVIDSKAAGVGNSVESESIDAFQVNPGPLIKFIQKYNHRLSVKPIQSLTIDDAMEYTFVNIGIRLLEDAGGDALEYFLDPDKLSALEAFKRTGFLQAILMGLPITFSHKRRNDKADRQYLGSSLNINDRQYVYMILLDSEILNDDKRLDVLDALADDFESKLANCFDSIYTSNRNMKGDGENAEEE